MNFKKILFAFGILLLVPVLKSGAQTGVCPPNIDFELGTTADWNYFIGSCCPISTPTPTPPLPSRHALTSGAGVDVYGGFPIVSPGGGSYSMKLGNDTGGAQAEKARYYVDVPSGVANFALVYRYAVVIEDPVPPHTAAQQPRFEVSAFDSATLAPIPCAAYSYVATSTLPGFTYSTVPSHLGSNGLDVLYKGWATASINLSGLGGTTVAIDFASGDCALGGHFGYGYLDMTCGLFQISGLTCSDTATTVNLSGPAGFENYYWYDSSTFTTLYGSGQFVTIPIPPTATTFALVLVPFAGYGCPDTLYSKITPTHLELAPSHDTTICGAVPISLTSGATDIALPLTYIWTPSTGLSCTTCASPTASPTVTTIYTVTVTDAAGCSKSAAIRVNVDLISGAMSAVNDTCAGYNNGSAHIAISSGFPPFSYTWSTVPVQTGPTASSLLAGTYTVTVVDNLGCTVNQTATILDGPPTVLSVLGSTNPTTCLGADGTIILGGLVPGSTFTVSYLFGGTIHTQTLVASGTGSVTLVGLSQGVYSSIGIITTHCPYNIVGPVTLTDPAPPVISYAGSNTPVCFGSALNLAVTATAGVSYAWHGPAGFTSPLQFPVVTPANFLDSGYYYITVGLNNCFTTDSTFAVIKPLPLPMISNNGPVCSGTTLHLNSSSSNGATSFAWNGPTGYYSGQQNPSIANVDTSATGTYTVTVTLNGCIAIATTNVLINPTPSAPLVADLEYCQFAIAAPLTATGTNLIWYTVATGGSGTPTAPTPSTQQEGIKTWYVSQLSPADCESGRSPLHVQVDYLAAPFIDLTDSVICNGNTFMFYAKNTGDDLTSLIWSFENGDSIVNTNPVRYSFEGPGTYSVSVTTYYKVCPVESASKIISVFTQPQLNVGNDTSICAGSVPLYLKDNINANNPAAQWLWNNGETSSTLKVTAPGMYCLKVTIHGCSSYDTIYVSNDCYMDIPNVFTPNGDGMNDYFFPRTLLTKGLTSFNMDIFNRWGQLIFSTTNIDGMGWDGKFNNEPQPEGVFIYKIDATFKDGQKEHHQGNITLLR